MLNEWIETRQAFPSPYRPLNGKESHVKKRGDLPEVFFSVLRRRYSGEFFKGGVEHGF